MWLWVLSVEISHCVGSTNISLISKWSFRSEFTPMPDAFPPSFFTLSASLLLMNSCLKQYANKSSKVT